MSETVICTCETLGCYECALHGELNKRLDEKDKRIAELERVRECAARAVKSAGEPADLAMLQNALWSAKPKQEG